MTESTWKIRKLDWKTPGFFSSKRVGTLYMYLQLDNISVICTKLTVCVQFGLWFCAVHDMQHKITQKQSNEYC